MLDREQIESLVRGFFHEACQYLNINDQEISINYLPMPVFMRLLLLQKDADSIVINTNMLDHFVKRNSYTPLRAEVYHAARDIYNRRKYIVNEKTATPKEIEMDGYAFAYAMCMLLGLRMPIPSLPEKESVIRGIKRIVNEEFSENCVLCKTPSRLFKGEFEYYLRKTQQKHKEIKELFNTKPQLVVSVVEPMRGTEQNPFDNVLEACKFIEQEEKKAYIADTFINDTLANRRFNYLAENNIYNIPWADAFVSMINNGIPEDGFIVNSLISGKFSFKPNLYRRKFLYRGQSEYFEKCVPNLYRDVDKDYYLDDNIWYEEMELMVRSHPLITLLEKGVNLMHDIFRFEMNYGGLCQHYYNRTRFLDLTSDLEAAKFFAVVDYDSKADKYIAHTTTNKLGVMYYYELSMPGGFSWKKGRARSTIGKQVFMRSGQQHGFLLNMDKGTNFNEFQEVHKVFFRHDPVISNQIYTASDNGKKYFPMDILQEEWKRKMALNTDTPFVSIDTVKLNVQDNILKKETINSITRKLEKYGIRVDKNYSPHFAPDLLDNYYENIKQGWWQDVFCKDIYFYGSDGVVYKNILMGLPNRTEYRKAFFR